MFLFLKVLLTEFIAEMGDKTQLMLVAMTQKFKIRDIIIGTAAGVLVLNGIAVVFGGLIGSFVAPYTIKVIANRGKNKEKYKYFAPKVFKK